MHHSAPVVHGACYLCLMHAAHPPYLIPSCPSGRPTRAPNPNTPPPLTSSHLCPSGRPTHTCAHHNPSPHPICAPPAAPHARPTHTCTRHNHTPHPICAPPAAQLTHARATTPHLIPFVPLRPPHPRAQHTHARATTTHLIPIVPLRAPNSHMHAPQPLTSSHLCPSGRPTRAQHTHTHTHRRTRTHTTLLLPHLRDACLLGCGLRGTPQAHDLAAHPTDSAPGCLMHAPHIGNHMVQRVFNLGFCLLPRALRRGAGTCACTHRGAHTIGAARPHPGHPHHTEDATHSINAHHTVSTEAVLHVWRQYSVQCVCVRCQSTLPLP